MYQFGDIILLAFPFTDTINVKKRPALVLLDTEDNDIIVARISTKTDETEYDISLLDWHSEGLITNSYVRLHKIATLDVSLIERNLGRLTTSDKQNVANKLKQIFDFT